MTLRSYRPVVDRLAARVAAVAVVATMVVVVAPASDAFASECTIVGTRGSDVLQGTPAADVICGGDGNDVLFGGAGDDKLLGGNGADTLDGQSGNDALDGGSGTDALSGSDGADALIGGPHSDILDGGEGVDSLDGGDSPDSLIGGGGNDLLKGGTSADTIDAGPGDDVADGGDSDDQVTGGAGADNLTGGSGADSLDGGDGNDVLVGGYARDVLRGGAGIDTLSGGTDSDTLVGGAGPDALDGGTGSDDCDGGTGANNFVACETVKNDPTPETGEPTEEPGLEVDEDVDGMPDLLEQRAGLAVGVADSDLDGLTDAEEFLGVSDPAVADTDGNGIADGQDDPDRDGLTMVEEARRGTLPGRADTDGDGLSDGDELARGTDPVAPDTDGDSVSDGTEVATALNPLTADSDRDGTGDADDSVERIVAGDAPGASFAASGPPSAVIEVTVSTPEDERLTSVPGQRGPPIEVTAPEGVSGTLTLTFDTTEVEPWTRLAVIHYDESKGTFDVPSQQTIDVGTGTATVTSSSFSPFLVVDLAEFTEAWNSLMARPTHDAPLDLGLILDLSPNWPYSASMAARQEQAAHALVDQLRPGDQLALGWYDSNGANYAPTLTSELAVVHEQITSLYANASGNNSYPMMGDALWSMTMALADQSDPARNRSIIAFGDGGGWSSPSDAWTGAFSVAIGHEIPYNFVAFEPLFLEYQVQAMADMTGGVLVKVKPDEAPRAAMNGKVYAASAGRAIDSDHDGLADTLEAAGLRDGTGHRYSTDPAKADTDGDGLSDGAEVGELRSDGAYASRTYYKLRSNPTAFDSDRDGLSDLYETANVLRPLAADNDRDGLNDFEEVQQQSTDPYLADTDGDGMSDSFEYYNRAQGTDPLVADAQLTALEYAGEFARGALCGDVEGWGGFCDSTQIPYLAGSLFAGFVIIGDVRDFVANAFGGQLGWAALNVVALVPAGGDAVSIVAKSVKFVHRIQPPTTLSLRSGASSVAAQDASAVRKWVLELDLPEYLKDRFLKESVGPSVNVLLDEGISSKSLIRMAKRGGRLDVLADAVRRADSVRSTKKPAGDYLLEQDAEDELRAVLSDDTPRAMFYKQEGGVDRIYDAYDEATDTLIEVKHGWTTYNGRARDQLTKDLARLQSGEIDRIEWAFFPNANGTFGPDKALLAAITNAQDRGLNISITLWVPTA